MAGEKYDMSARTLRRLTMLWAAALVLFVPAALVWVVDAGQRTVLIGWSTVGAVLLLLVVRTVPDSAVRPVRPPRSDHPYRDAWRTWPTFVIPTVIGPLSRSTIPGDASFGVTSAVVVAAVGVGVGVSVPLGIALDRRRVRRGASEAQVG